MWTMLASLMGGTVKDWISHKSQLEQRKAVARIENVSKGIPGWSDEYLIVVWSYPFIAAFIPAMQPSVTGGFSFMDSMPGWYISGFITLSFAVFGIDKLFKFQDRSAKKDE